MSISSQRILLAAMLCLACGGAGPSSSEGTASSNPAPDPEEFLSKLDGPRHGRVHLQRPRPPGGSTALGGLAPGRPELRWWGGSVIPHPQVFVVRFGPDARSFPFDVLGIDTFYQSYVDSPLMDWLNDSYGLSQAPKCGNHKGDPSAGQIGRGVVRGTFDMIPDSSQRSQTVWSEGDIQSLLEDRMFNTSASDPRHIPWDPDGIYMVHISGQYTAEYLTVDACETPDVLGSGWCAMHTNFKHGDKFVHFAMIPDMSTPLCQQKCGTGDSFRDTTAVATHELVETIVDPAWDITATSTWGPFDPDECVAWDDPTFNDGFLQDMGGEVADVCGGATQTFPKPLTPGQTYTVSKIWSMQENRCITAAHDFTVTAQPSHLSIMRGTSTTVSIVTDVIGDPSNVSLGFVRAPGSDTSGGGLPANVTAVWQDGRVTSGTVSGWEVYNTDIQEGTSVGLTLNIGNNATPGKYRLNITAVDDFNHNLMQSVHVDFEILPFRERLSNGGFELGTSGWNLAPTNGPIITTSGVHGGTQAMQLMEDDAIQQTLTIPTNTPHAYLSLWLKAKCADQTHLKGSVQIVDNHGFPHSLWLDHCDSADIDWTQVSADLATSYRGQTVLLRISASDGAAWGFSQPTFLVDHASLLVQDPP